MSDEETTVEVKGKKAKSEKLDHKSFKSKSDAAKAAIQLIKKTYGEEAINLFGDAPLKDVETISTGSLGLDVALGVGGYPKGRIIEIFGPEASGKTTLTLHAIANAQKAGGLAAFIDVEHALDPAYARNLGVDMDALAVSQPMNGEEALGIAETLAASGAYDIIVIDSVAALVPKAELEAEMGASTMGSQARLMSQALRKLTAIVDNTKTILIFINQIRMKIGVIFGSPETTTGGNALKFYASQRLDIRKVGTLKQGEDVVGTRTRVKVIKNKVAPPFTEVEFDILYGKGVNYNGELIDCAVQISAVEKAGAWYSYQGERIGQGRDKAVAFLGENPKMAAALDAEVRKHFGLEKE